MRSYFQRKGLGKTKRYIYAFSKTGIVMKLNNAYEFELGASAMLSDYTTLILIY